MGMTCSGFTSFLANYGFPTPQGTSFGQKHPFDLDGWSAICFKNKDLRSLFGFLLFIENLAYHNCQLTLIDRFFNVFSDARFFYVLFRDFLAISRA